MELISIIVPIYMIEKYLIDCIQSIINQTYKNLEIILVDDGSPDNSPAICDEFAKKDNRIKVIHKTNGGVAAARNTGLDAATGNYIGFVDSDDWIEPNMIEIMYNLINENESDIAICGYSIISPNNIVLSDERKMTVQIDNKETLKEVLMGSIKGFLWNKLFKRSLFDGTRIPENMDLCEDLFTCCKILADERKVVYTNKALYNYRQIDNSITHDFNKYFDSNCNLKTLVVLEAIRKIYTDKKEILKYVDICESRAVEFIFMLALRMNNYKRTSIVQYDYLHRNIKKYYFIYLRTNTHTIKNKIKYSLLVIAPISIKLITRDNRYKTNLGL